MYEIYKMDNLEMYFLSIISEISGIIDKIAIIYKIPETCY